MSLRPTLYAALWIPLASCTGDIGTPARGVGGGQPGTPGGPALTCETGPVATNAPLQRLAVEDYARTLRGLFGDEAMAAVQSDFAQLPADSTDEEGFFDRQDQRLSQGRVDLHYAIADALSQATAGDGALRARVGDACGGAVTADCLAPFAERFLTRALRRRVSADEVRDAVDLAEEMGGGEDGVHAIVFTTLMNPEVLYRFELRGEDLGDGRLALAPEELAARLAFTFWGEGPDAALLDRALSGELDDERGYAATVDAVLDDPRTDAQLERFFAEWMHLEDRELEASPRLDTLAPDLDTAGLLGAMRDETLSLFMETLHGGGTWSDVLTSRASYATDARLAEIYGVAPWDGEGAPPELPASERSGLLTRAALLASSDGSTNPFRRGAFLRRLLFCDDVPAPPGDLPGDALTPPPVAADASTREQFAAKVTGEPCASCHASFTPLGWAMEAYDGLGRFRRNERLVTDLGEELGTVPVDATASVDFDGDEVPVSGPVELSEELAASGLGDLCLSRQMFRFTFRREETRGEACVVEHFGQDLYEGRSLREWLREIALSPTFRERLLPAD